MVSKKTKKEVVSLKIADKKQEDSPIKEPQFIQKPKKKAWKKVLFISFVVILLIILLIGGYVAYNHPSKKPPAPPSAPTTPTNYTPKVWAYGYVNYTNVMNEMAGSKFVKDLPENSRVVLEIYNRSEGVYTTEKIYLIENNQVIEVSFIPENDLAISMSSKYLVDFKKESFCYVVQNAQRNDEMWSSSNLSTTKLLWKFKSMLEYRDCMGF